MNARNRIRRFVWLVLILIPAAVAWAEYADVVINEMSEEAGVSPVIYPHWFHRIRYQCSVCHVDLGFKTKAGGNGITMDKIIQGEYCGACHNGEIAWSAERGPRRIVTCATAESQGSKRVFGVVTKPRGRESTDGETLCGPVRRDQ